MDETVVRWRLSTTDATFETAFRALLAAKRDEETKVDDAVATIIDEVKRDGDAALVRLTERFDGLSLSADALRLDADAIAALAADARPETLSALDLAADRILAFHERQRPQDELWTDAAGMRIGWRWRPVSAAGLYAPGGRASYPSSVLMNALPAAAAGCPRRAMCVPTPRGETNPLVFAAARRAGVDEIYRIGGAQAIAAMAYGTESIPRVDVVVGPGNAYVASAKKQVFGDVGIDSVAGPSEVVVIADDSAPAEWLAADLLAQAEHDEAAQSILIATDAAVADAVAAAVARQLETAPRRAIAEASWRAHGAIIVARDLDEAAEVSDRLAPEHLQLAVRAPEALAEKTTRAGAIFLGAHTPEALGDYVAGPNHVLPTGGSARFASGLSTLTFMTRTTVSQASAEALAALGPAAAALADAEGLDAHARSLRIRTNAAS